jgi:hypothetical protein
MMSYVSDVFIVTFVEGCYCGCLNRTKGLPVVQHEYKTDYLARRDEIRMRVRSKYLQALSIKM